VVADGRDARTRRHFVFELSIPLDFAQTDRRYCHHKLFLDISKIIQSKEVHINTEINFPVPVKMHIIPEDTWGRISQYPMDVRDTW
jgi:hypothetical protein